MKKCLLYLGLGGFLIFLLCYPSQAMKASATGLELCVSKVIPSLFPFFILSSLLIKTGFLSAVFRPFQPIFSRLFGISPAGAGVFFLGACAGYPIGAKSVVELTESKQISLEEGNRLLGFCNNAGPLFLVGTVGIGMFGNADCGYLLLYSHLISAVLVGLFFRRKTSVINEYKTHTAQLSWNLLSDSLNGAILSTLSVCGYIILFQVIICALYHTGIFDFFSNLLTAGKAMGIGKSVLCGMIEMTSGVHLISQFHSLSMRTLLTLASAVLGFGGLCVHAQTFGIIKKFHKKTYLTGKFLQGMFSAIITYLLYPAFFADTAVFYTHVPTQQELKGELYLTLFLLAITLLFYFAFLTVSFFKSKK